MPELPDVEHFRQYLEATALHQEIEDVDVRSQQILEADAQELREGLEGHSFEGTRRHGKHLFVRLDNERWLELHFGMSGNLAYFKDMAKEPEYDRLLFTFTNGYHLAYTAPRKLGEVDLVDDIGAFAEAHDLGPDVYADTFDLETFKSLLANRRGMIKSALMDQSLMAGIGNVYSDEILFQVGIHPRTKVQALSEEQLERIYDEMQKVLKVAIDHRADPSTFPDGWLTPHRGEDGTCARCGGPLKRVKVSGRTAYYCLNRQGESPGEPE